MEVSRTDCSSWAEVDALVALLVPDALKSGQNEPPLLPPEEPLVVQRFDLAITHGDLSEPGDLGEARRCDPWSVVSSTSQFAYPRDTGSVIELAAWYLNTGLSHPKQSFGHGPADFTV